MAKTLKEDMEDVARGWGSDMRRVGKGLGVLTEHITALETGRAHLEQQLEALQNETRATGNLTTAASDDVAELHQRVRAHEQGTEDNFQGVLARIGQLEAWRAHVDAERAEPARTDHVDAERAAAAKAAYATLEQGGKLDMPASDTTRPWLLPWARPQPIETCPKGVDVLLWSAAFRRWYPTIVRSTLDRDWTHWVQAIQPPPPGDPAWEWHAGSGTPPATPNDVTCKTCHVVKRYHHKGGCTGRPAHCCGEWR